MTTTSDSSTWTSTSTRHHIDISLIMFILICPSNSLDELWCPDGYHLGPRTLNGVCQLVSCLDNDNQSNIVDDTVTVDFINGTNRRHYCKTPKPCSNRRRFNNSEYTIADNGTGLWLISSNDFVPLGDFVIVANGSALVCWPHKDSVETIPEMCLPFTLPATECQLMSNGSLRAININVTYSSGYFDNGLDEYHVCHNLSDEFIRCKHKDLIKSQYCQRMPDMSLLYTNLSVAIVYQLGSYAWTADHYDSILCIQMAPPSHLVDKDLKLLVEIALIASAFFLLITLLVHVFVKPWTNHNKVFVCHVLSLLIMFVTMAIRYLGQIRDSTQVQCYTVFSIGYIATLGSFFWLSVLAFELWRGFSNLRPQPSMQQSSLTKRRRFLLQCVYAWGIPILLCIAVLITVTNKGIEKQLNLKFHMRHFCWIVEHKTAFIFIYVPIIIILIENTIFFVLTVLNLRKASQGMDILNKNVGRQMFGIFIKLFIVMELFWFVDFFTWLLRTRTNGTVWPHPIDLVNSLQGVFIFILYVLNKKTIRSIENRLRQLWVRTGNTKILTRKTIASRGLSTTNSTPLADRSIINKKFNNAAGNRKSLEDIKVKTISQIVR